MRLVEHLVPVVLTALLLTLGAGPALAAGVYKWKDAEGKVHFSDVPPANGESAQAGAVSEVKLKDDAAGFRVANKPIIRNERGATGPTLALTQFSLQLGAASNHNVTIGHRFYGFNCERVVDVQWKDGVIDLKGKVAEQQVVERFRSAAYVLAAGSATDETPPVGDLELESQLVGLRLEACDKENGSGFGSKAFVRMRWTLKNAAGDQVFRGTTEGASDGWYDGTAVAQTAQRALAQATDNLLGDQEFIGALRRQPAPELVSRRDLPVAVRLSYGDGASSFRSHSEDLLKSAVTVRTSRGHGSGVIVDLGGYAVTNAHVVGNDSSVQVVLDGKSVKATVMRLDRHIDVALLKFDASGLKLAPLASKEPHPGDPLYVVGTPLTLELSHTVTQGILSAVREVDGVRLFQTDAAINPGNSGGPVFNENGELVAISVAGLFNRQGASMNVNYLLPVSAVLSGLGLGGTTQPPSY